MACPAMESSSNWTVIGIGGATCSGKTTIANELRVKLPNTVVVHQDNYYHPIGSPCLEYIDEMKHYNWDKLSAIDTKRLIDDVRAIIKKPGQRNVLIVEGTVVLNVDQLREICAFKYYFTLPYEVGKLRRQKKNYEIPDPPENFDEIVWPLYLKYKQELTYEDIRFIDSSDNDVQAIIAIILKDVGERLNC